MASWGSKSSAAPASQQQRQQRRQLQRQIAAGQAPEAESLPTLHSAPFTACASLPCPALPRPVLSCRGHLCITCELLSINLYEYIKASNFKVGAGLVLQLA
jgi:hypothetical protein